MGRPLLLQDRVVITGSISPEADYLELKMQTENGMPLTRQAVLDVVSDYLLIDPANLFALDDA